MISLFGFMRKELLEYLRSYKLFILWMAFLAFGFLNPISARYLPELMSDLLPSEMILKLPDPTVLDSWEQFFKNVAQLGMLILLIVFSTMMSNEFSQGTLIQLLTRGLSRASVILAKFLVAAAIWSLCLLTSFLVTYLYNLMFWQPSGAPHLFFGVLNVWLFGLLLISLLLLGGVLGKSSITSLLCAGIFFLLCMLASLFPLLQDLQPARLLLEPMTLLLGTSVPADFYTPLLCTIVLIPSTLCLTIVLFSHSQL